MVLVVFVQCSTEKDAFINKAYHGMTTRYNGYFNAGELIKETRKNFLNSYQDDYDQILSIYRYGDEITSKSLYPNMDKAIQKCEKVIAKHSMPGLERAKKNEEWNKWIDDSWLVMGIAHFHKREFNKAVEKFKFIKNSYPTEPIIYDATLWLGKTYLEMGNYNQAFSSFNELLLISEQQSQMTKKEIKEVKKIIKEGGKNAREQDPIFDDKLLDDIEVCLADYYIRKKDYPNAIERLEKGIELTKKKRFRGRLVFILAQLYEANNNPSLAATTYLRVPKHNPPYEMEFYARIKSALLFQGGDSKGLKAQLLKMLKDEKNVDFQDQIYYALAEIELKEGNRNQGEEYLVLSTQKSTNNVNQKAKSFVRLADLYFDDRNYVNASNYYDSSLSVILEDHPKYEEIREKSVSLNKLVDQINTIEYEDSMRYWSAAEEKELNKHIDELIQKVVEEEERQREIEEMNQMNLVNNNTNNNNRQNAGGFYFSNRQTMSLGFTEFTKRWGNRKLEDNWRRSNKSSISNTIDEGEEEGQDSLGNNKTREYYTQNLYKTPDEIEESHEKTMTAYYEAGYIYKEKLKDYEEAIKNFSQVVNNYPKGEKAPVSCYQLYLSHKELNNSSEANKYKTMVCESYPTSEYCKLLNNPNYYQDKLKAEKRAAREYDETYNKFLAKNYDAVLNDCEKVLNNDEGNDFICKYRLLSAYAKAEKYGLTESDEFEIALKETTENCEGTSEAARANEILNILLNRKSVEAAKEGQSPYIYSNTMDHYFVIIFPNSAGSINKAKAKVSDFNKKYFSPQDYKTSNTFLNGDNGMILVKTFGNKNEAMNYYVAFANASNELGTLNKEQTYFVITHQNYSSFYIEKDVEEYMEFFEKNYK